MNIIFYLPAEKKKGTTINKDNIQQNHIQLKEIATRQLAVLQPVKKLGCL